MGTRIVRVAGPSQGEQRARRPFDPAGTTLMVVISASVLAASVMIASLSAGAGQGQSLSAGPPPQPGPAPTLSTPAP